MPFCVIIRLAAKWGDLKKWGRSKKKRRVDIQEETKCLTAGGFQADWPDSMEAHSYLDVFIVVLRLEINDHYPLESLKPETSIFL